MTEQENEFLQRLLATFKVEAQEHIDTLFAGLAELEQVSDAHQRNGIVETMFREAHSLKGAARSVGLTPVESACQGLESLFAALKRQGMPLSAAEIDQIHQTLAQLGALLALPHPEKSSSSPLASAPAMEPAVASPVNAPPPVSETRPSASTQTIAKEKTASASTVRIATDKLDAIFLQTEELLSAKIMAQQHKQELQVLLSNAAAWHKDWNNLIAHHPEFYAIAASQPQWQELMERNTRFIKDLILRLGSMAKTADLDQRMLGRMVDDLLEDTKKALMLPFSTLTETFPRLVRDLCKSSGKDIALEIRGGELEADRRILEAIKDPLIHLIRNCVDHGIEKPEQRSQYGKPARGSITVEFHPRSGNRVEITIADDGAGIDTNKVKATAARMGLLDETAAASLEEPAILELIYQSGLSTSPILTEISGRGLGLAIVREKIDKLGGTIAISSQAGLGTRFCISLPLTLATYRGIGVRIGDQTLVLPTSNVVQTLRIARDQVRTVENRATIHINGETLALAWLADTLELARQAQEESVFLQIVILASAGKRMAFAVDEVLSEQEVLVKSLGKQLSRVRNIAAATILGSGKAVPVLNVTDLMKSATKPTRAHAIPISEEGAPAERSVLVVEDSITARSLLKGILEMAGYRVTTAVDGIDGLTQLRSGSFDAVVSDVEMPRMDGFELTAKIRSDKKLAELPVVLVTSLDSREDRERGIDVGANAYIVKRSFEQSNLIEVVGRLI